jgi:hypothetical protein
METTPPSHSDRREGVQKAAEMLIASLPVVGGALQIAFQDAMGRSLVQRRERWLTELAMAVNELRDQVGDFDKIAKNATFVDAVITATQIADRTSRDEKRELLRNAVLNAAFPDAPDEDIQQLFFDLLDRLTPTHVRLLKVLTDPPGWFEKTGFPRPQFAMSSNRSALIEAAMPELAGRRDVIERYYGGLTTGGLVSAPLGGMMTANGAFQPAASELGREFLAFVEDPREGG